MNKKVVQEFIVKTEDVDTRLDIFVSSKLNITRSQSQKMIKEGLVEVGNKAIGSSYKVTTGDHIFIHDLLEKDLDVNIPVVFEDEEIIVIDKPSGITAHPAPGEKDITVTEIFPRGIIVHRLDKGTSGVMVLAKSEGSAENLKEQFQKRKVTKKYLALVHGKVSPGEGIIDMPLSRSLAERNKIAPVDEGRQAKTLYKVIKYYKSFTLLEAQPKTGRTHQIRVHLSAIGFPLFGDLRYGKNTDKTDRIFLHAKELSFLHPRSGVRVTFRSELPTELEKVLSGLD